MCIDENKEILEQFKTDPRHAGTQHWDRACLGTLESCQNIKTVEEAWPEESEAKFKRIKVELESYPASWSK